MIHPGSQNARVLAVLADGKSHGVPEIHRRAGTMRLNSRVSELRKHGYAIVCTRTAGVKGARAYRYQWTDAPPLTPAEEVFAIPAENVAPRDARKSAEAVGTALCTLGAESEFRDCTVGVLDTNGTADKPGTWVINPWDGRP